MGLIFFNSQKVVQFFAMGMTPYSLSVGKMPGSSHIEEKKLTLVLLTRYLRRKNTVFSQPFMLVKGGKPLLKGRKNQCCIPCKGITFNFEIGIFKT